MERIASGQVITDLAAGVKELVENGLDAGASFVEVHLWGDGIDAFEVIDDGCGMSAADLETLGGAHSTSKLSRFEDLDGVSTLGFRGEAFHSLCKLSQTVRVITRDASSTVGLHAEYQGTGLKSVKPCASSRGTKVKVSGLFHEYAVRLSDWRRNGKKMVARVLKSIQAYAIGFPRVKFRVLSHDGNGRPQVLMASSGSGEVPLAFSELFGISSTHMTTASHSTDGWTIQLTSGTCNAPRRSTSDRQFFFVNGHPSDQRLLQKACNEAYRDYGPETGGSESAAGFPPLALHVLAGGGGGCDVNLTPDKRMITLVEERAMAERVKEMIREQVFARLPMSCGSTEKSSRYSQTLLSELTVSSQATSDSPSTLDLTPEKPPVSEESHNESHTLGDSAGCGCATVPVAIQDPVSDSLSREDFLEMQVLGQFNCGFILARLHRQPHDQDSSALLYIVDQHAADERFRLETLEQSDSLLSQQPLLAPKQIVLAPDDAMTVLHHQEQLAALGFRVSLRRADTGSTAGADGRETVWLHAVPHVLSATLTDQGTHIHITND